MAELKPCPFCGGNAIVMNMGYPHWIYCEQCGDLALHKPNAETEFASFEPRSEAHLKVLQMEQIYREDGEQ